MGGGEGPVGHFPLGRQENYDALNLKARHDLSEEEIKKAFREQALRWHPDKFFNASDIERQKAEQNFVRAKDSFERVLAAHGYKHTGQPAEKIWSTAQYTAPSAKRVKKTNMMIAACLVGGVGLFVGMWALFHVKPLYEGYKVTEGDLLKAKSPPTATLLGRLEVAKSIRRRQVQEQKLEGQDKTV